jgi:hypothetical protein
MIERDQCVGLVVLLGIILGIFVWKFFSREAVGISKSEVPSLLSSPSARSNPYLNLRMQALEMPADLFDVVPDARRPVVYGVVMDWELGNGSVTLVSFVSGDTSTYTSSGGGVIGGIGHENVRNASIAFIKKAKDSAGKFLRSDDSSLPPVNSFKFFMLTTEGRFVAGDTLLNIENRSSPLLELFEEANKVITELRKTAPDDQ